MKPKVFEYLETNTAAPMKKHTLVGAKTES